MIAAAGCLLSGVQRNARRRAAGRGASGRGVTLVELLITIAILTILAAAIYGAAGSAMESARAARTKSTIAKIHGLLMERWESYETRRLSLKPAIVQQINQNFQGLARNRVMSDLRLLARRELMKLEMPDRWSDVLNAGVPTGNPSSAPAPTTYFLSQPSPLTQSYYRRYLATANRVDRDTLLANEAAECLFMTIMSATGDGEARTLFSEQDVGDTDGDGALEFLDGWGQPIRYIRWPAGHVERSTIMSGDWETDHDPFDVFRRDALPSSLSAIPYGNYPTTAMQRSMQAIQNRNAQAEAALAGTPRQYLGAFRLVPLVFSAGPDRRTGLVVAVGFAGPTVADPYAPTDVELNGVALQLGAVYDEDGQIDSDKDNISNHDG